MQDSTFKILAESTHFTLGHAYESVSVIYKANGLSFLAGQHYGDPVSGLITPDEVWFVTAGEGLQCYSHESGLQAFFREGFAPLAEQSSELCWHVHSVRLESSRLLRVLIDPWSKFASVWQLDLNELSLAKLSDGPLLSDTPYRDDVAY